MYLMEFWGGPKDGGTIQQSTKISREVFCASNESTIMDLDEFNEIRNFPNRSQKYFRYILESSKDNIVKYKYCGIV